jgi:hypothetical protein
MAGDGLSPRQVTGFARDGFVRVEQAFPRDIADACTALLWERIGADPDDPGTWTKPVEWVYAMSEEPFVAAANTPRLHAAFDQLVGPGRWAPRPSLGAFPLRFPHEIEPDDAGWHIEASYQPDGADQHYTNVFSRNRALLMLFLFSEVDEANAPTRIRVGSHRDVPPVLAPFGVDGAPGETLGPLVNRASAHRPVALATGSPGDVYLCHPFLVHAAQPHHGTRPRFLAQPPLHPQEPLNLDRPDGRYSLVEAAIREALAGSPPAAG